MNNLPPTQAQIAELVELNARRILVESEVGAIKFIQFKNIGEPQDEGVLISARGERVCERVTWSRFERVTDTLHTEIIRRARLAARRIGVKCRASLSRAKA